MTARKFTAQPIGLVALRSLFTLGLSLGLLALTLLVLQGTGHAAPSPQSAPGDVVINEVAWGGTAANYSSHEWIELYNNTASPIDLTGWRLYSSDGGPSITLSGTIPAFGYYLIERSTDNAIRDIPADWVGSFGTGLSNSGEVLTLTDHLATVVDTANGDGGGWPAGSGSPGYLSMERIDPAAPDSATNWASNNGIIRNGQDASGNPISGTPKCRNSVASPEADLVVLKSAPMEAWAGQAITYILRLRNAGNVSATGVYLTDTLPNGISLLGQSSPYTFTEPISGTLVWEIGTLPISTTFTSVTVTVQIAERFSDTLVNAVTATTAVTEAVTGNNVAWATTAVHQILPDLRLTKTGPSIVAVGETITYTLILTNNGLLTATESLLTDTLPLGLDSIQGTPAPSVFAPPILAWELGEVPPAASLLFTITGQVTLTTPMTLVNHAIVTSVENDAYPEDNATYWTTSLIPYLRLYALAPVNYYGSGEAAALINLAPYTVPLTGWCLDDRSASTSRVCFPAGAEIGPEQILWLAQNADGFYPVWGFDADWAAQSAERPVPLLSGSWPGFTDRGEAAYLLSGTVVVDALVYTDTLLPSLGWSGPAVPYPYPGYSSGQVLYRKLDPATGRPVPDTDTAADWAQDPVDPLLGRKLRYPGWDLEALFFPAEITATAGVTIAVAPEGSLSLTLQTIAQARQSLRVEGYTLESVPVYEAIQERIRAGVVVTVLLESQPTGGMSSAEKWIAQRLHNPPTSTVYFIGKEAARYRFQHAKFILVDDRLAFISSENFTERSMPSDLIVNGTAGHRGFLLVTDSPGVIARLAEVFRRDADPTHADVVPYTDAYAPPTGYVPLPPPDWTTYTTPFSQVQAAMATTLTVLHGPEHLLRPDDGLLGLLGRVGRGDAVAVMQLNEPVTWTYGVGDAGTNPRVQALVAAARRGASVRILLDEYYDTGTNFSTCLYLNEVARAGDLDLTCRLGNVTGLGTHAKAFFVRVGDEKWVHIGSVNGTETSHKANREVALQFASAGAYDFLTAVFEHDWARAHAPLIFHLYLPLVLRDYVPPADYPLITEVFINPPGDDAGKEWIEIYNPGPTVEIGGWTIGDAINIGDYGDGRYAFPAGARLLSRQVIVVAACAPNFAAVYGFNPTYEWTNCDPLVPDLIPVGAWAGFELALGNAQDEVLLLKPDGAPVDSVAWGGEPRAGVVPFPMDPGDTFPWSASLKRYPPHSDRNDCARDFYVSWSPSPGWVTGE